MPSNEKYQSAYGNSARHIYCIPYGRLVASLTQAHTDLPRLSPTLNLGRAFGIWTRHKRVQTPYASVTSPFSTTEFFAMNSVSQRRTICIPPAVSERAFCWPQAKEDPPRALAGLPPRCHQPSRVPPVSARRRRVAHPDIAFHPRSGPFYIPAHPRCRTPGAGRSAASAPYISAHSPSSSSATIFSAYKSYLVVPCPAANLHRDRLERAPSLRVGHHPIYGSWLQIYGPALTVFAGLCLALRLV
ncbi:hypothetical protein DFH09DRAFT_1362660 [Mycena vulgaris]|nr:hypothetical protein DFH09DRAFT_1362660 [Mycena vulgaris]